MPLTVSPKGAPAFEFFNQGASLQINIPVETSIALFRRKSIQAPAIAQNYLNMFAFANVGRDMKARFGSIKGPKHALRKRGKGCVWNPSKCGTSILLDEIDTCPIEFQQEQCVNALWGECWEKLLGTGNDVYQIDATAEGAQILGLLIDEIYKGIGNSYYHLAMFGLHPLIEQAQANSWYVAAGISQDEWDCFYAQQQACGGILTQIDHLKDNEGLSHFNVEIQTADVSGKKYIGDPTELFQRLEDNMSREMEICGETEGNGGLIIAVTKGIFNAYRDQLVRTYQNIPASLQLLMKGDLRCDGCLDLVAPGVLQWNGYWIVRMTEWSLLDYFTDTVTHRAVMLLPGVFGLAYDVPPTEQFTGFGMEITNWRRAPLKGKTYFDTTLRMGTAILDTEMMVNASLTLTPA